MHSILVLSDIHGDIDTLNLILEKENYDYVFFLGDAIDYYWKEENKEVIDKLSNISKILFSVKGNCDNFHTPYNNPLIQRITIDNINYVLTHGMLYNKYTVGDYDIYIEGHTHKSKIIKENNKIIINPGSISKPRGNTYKSYIIIKNNIIYLKDIYGNIIETTKIR